MLKHSISLYFSAVFIWGSTFFAIKFQLGEVPEQLSIAYRFTLASMALFLWCWWRGLPMGFSPRQHLWWGMQGLTLFCLNYLVIYWATAVLTSGLIAVVFSTIVLMNILNGALFLGKSIRPVMIAGALLGLLGISLVFWPELTYMQQHPGSLKGLLLCLLGTFIASLGNVISAYNQTRQIPIVQGNAFGMGYGALILWLLALGQGETVSYDDSLAYNLSLLYLVLFGSIFAFGSYLTLLGRIGPEKAAYAMVLFPLVALAISTLFEGYQWTASAGLGVALVLAENILIITPRRYAQSVQLWLKSGSGSKY